MTCMKCVDGPCSNAGLNRQVKAKFFFETKTKVMVKKQYGAGIKLAPCNYCDDR